MIGKLSRCTPPTNPPRTGLKDLTKVPATLQTFVECEKYREGILLGKIKLDWVPSAVLSEVCGVCITQQYRGVRTNKIQSVRITLKARRVDDTAENNMIGN